MTTIAGASVGATVGAGTGVLPADGTAVGAAVVGAAVVGAAVVGAAVVGAAVVGGTDVAVADEPQAKITASRRVKDPRIMAFGFFNQ